MILGTPMRRSAFVLALALLAGLSPSAIAGEKVLINDSFSDGDTVTFEHERVRVEPFDLRYTPKYDLILDRLTHWYMVSREWVKKAVLMDGVYVLKNPWAIQSYEKHTSYCAMMRLGMPIPDTWMIPAKSYDVTEHADLEVTVDRYNALFSLDAVGESVGYPAFLKPYDGGGWVGVKQVKTPGELHAAYDASGKRVHHLQAAVKDWDVFIRGIGVGLVARITREREAARLAVDADRRRRTDGQA